MNASMKSARLWVLPRSAPRSSFAVGVVFVAILVISIIVGLSLGSGIYLVAAAIGATFPAILLLIRPDLCLLAMAAATLLVAGTLKYFAGLGQFQWAISALGLLLLIVALTKSSFSKAIGVRRIPASGIGVLLVLWWAVIVVASLGNMTPLLDWFVGFRIYLPFLGVFAYIAYCRPAEPLIRGLFKFLLLICAIQWIFCIYQKLVIVPQRIAGGFPGSPWDSIVGTFGGERFGGGESGSLGVFLAVTLSIAAALHKAKALGGTAFAVVMIFGLIAVGLAESKVVVVLVPLGALIVYHDYIVQRPLRFILGALLVVGFILGLLTLYYYFYWQSSTRLGLVESVVERLSYSFDPNFRASASNLGRIGSLVFWWNSHSIFDNPLTFLIGHGLASAVGASSLIGMGSAVQKYGYLLDTTGATKLLWESGLIGLVLFLATFVLGFLRAHRLAQIESIPPWHRAVLVGAQAGMVLMFLAVFYEVTTVSSPPMQFLNMLLMGYIVHWWRETGGGQR